MTPPPRSGHSPATEVSGEPAENTSHDELWRQHASALTRYATLLVGPDDAHDIVSIAFHRVVRRLSGGQPIDNVRAYLMRTVTNTASDQRRSERRRQARDLRAALAEPSWVADSQTGTAIDIRHAIAGLSVQQRAVVYFTYWEDLDSRQIGELLDISPATARRHLARARFILRKELS